MSATPSKEGKKNHAPLSSTSSPPSTPNRKFSNPSFSFNTTSTTSIREDSLTSSSASALNPTYANPSFSTPQNSSSRLLSSSSSATRALSSIRRPNNHHNNDHENTDFDAFSPSDTPYTALNDNPIQFPPFNDGFNRNNPAFGDVQLEIAIDSPQFDANLIEVTGSVNAESINPLSQANAEPAAFPAKYYQVQRTKDPFVANLLQPQQLFDSELERYPLRTRHPTRITHGSLYYPCWKNILSQRTIARLPRCCDSFGFYHCNLLDCCFYFFGTAIPFFIISILISLNRSIYDRTPNWFHSIQILHPYLIICLLPIFLAIFTMAIARIHYNTRVAPIKMIPHGSRRHEIAKIQRILTNFETTFIEPRLKVKIQYYHLRDKKATQKHYFRSNLAWGLSDKTSSQQRKKAQRVIDGTKEYTIPILSYKRLNNITAKEYSSRLHDYVNCGQAIVSATTQCKLVSAGQKLQLDRIITFLKSKSPQSVFPTATHSKVVIISQSVKPLVKQDVIAARVKWERYLVNNAGSLKKLLATIPNSSNHQYSYHYHAYEETDVEDDLGGSGGCGDESADDHPDSAHKNPRNIPLFSRGNLHRKNSTHEKSLLSSSTTTTTSITTTLSSSFSSSGQRISLSRQPSHSMLNFGGSRVATHPHNDSGCGDDNGAADDDDGHDDDGDDHTLPTHLSRPASSSRYKRVNSNSALLLTSDKSNLLDASNISGFVLSADHDSYDPLRNLNNDDDGNFTSFPHLRQFVIDEDPTTQSLLEKIISALHRFQSSIYRAWIVYLLIVITPCLPFLVPRLYRYSNRDIQYKHSFAVVIPDAEAWIAVWEDPKLRHLVLKLTRPGDIDNPG